MQVGHKHSSEGAQDPVHLFAIVTTQLPECAFTTVQQQGLVGATEKSERLTTGRSISTSEDFYFREEQEAAVALSALSQHLSL